MFSCWGLSFSTLLLPYILLRVAPLLVEVPAQVSHYLDHIQPAIDQLAARECHYFADLDPTVLPEAQTVRQWSSCESCAQMVHIFVDINMCTYECIRMCKGT